MDSIIKIRAQVEYLPPFLKPRLATKLWLRLESNPMLSESEEKLYAALTERLTALASFGEVSVTTLPEA